jgi:hypothetical protein
MNDAFNGLFVFLTFLQVVVLVVLARSEHGTMKELADYEQPTVSLDPKPEAPPGFFLRHFNSPQRAYLRQQRGWIAAYIFCSWLLLVFFRRGELNSDWNLGWCAFVAFIFAQTSVEPQVLELRFIRTRPLTLCFLFWSRTGAALTSLLAAIATAVLELFLKLRPSPLPPFLPLLTTTTLVFSLGVAIDNLYWRLISNSTSKFASLFRSLLWFPFFYLLIHGISSIRFASILFRYNNAGSPASYAYALVLLAITAALLKLAQFVNERREAS